MQNFTWWKGPALKGQFQNKKYITYTFIHTPAYLILWLIFILFDPILCFGSFLGLEFLFLFLFFGEREKKMAEKSLIYSFVARGKEILAEYTEFTGNFTSVAAQCLEKLPSTNNSFNYNCDGHTFNYLVENGFSEFLFYFLMQFMGCSIICLWLLALYFHILFWIVHYSIKSISTWTYLCN